MTNPQHLKRIAEVLEAYDSLDSTAEIVPSWAKENYKDLRKFKAMYKRYGADKAHEVRHQVLRAQGWAGSRELDEAFADAKSKTNWSEATTLKANEWRKAYGGFNAKRYIRLLKILRFVEKKYGTATAVKLVKILEPNRQSIRTAFGSRFRRYKNKR